MKNIGALMRREDGSQAIRHSAALTTVYLLEMNRKFEAFMREKVEVLEGRVSAQQARLSFEWADLELDDDVQDEELLPLEPAPSLGETEPMPAPDAGDQAWDNLPAEPLPEPAEAELPDYTTLLIGDPEDMASSENEAEDPFAEDEVVPGTNEGEETVDGEVVMGETTSPNSQMAEAGAEEQPEWPEPEPMEYDLDVDTGEETVVTSGAEPAAIAETPAPSAAQGEGERWGGKEKLVLLAADELPEDAGIPAIELLTAEPATLLGWSAEAEEEVPESEALTMDNTGATDGDEAGLDMEYSKDVLDDSGAETTASEEVDDIDDEKEDAWDSTLPSAGQKGDWA